MVIIDVLHSLIDKWFETDLIQRLLCDFWKSLKNKGRKMLKTTKKMPSFITLSFILIITASISGKKKMKHTLRNIFLILSFVVFVVCFTYDSSFEWANQWCFDSNEKIFRCKIFYFHSIYICFGFYDVMIILYKTWK